LCFLDLGPPIPYRSQTLGLKDPMAPRPCGFQTLGLPYLWAPRPCGFQTLGLPYLRAPRPCGFQTLGLPDLEAPIPWCRCWRIIEAQLRMLMVANWLRTFGLCMWSNDLYVCSHMQNAKCGTGRPMNLSQTLGFPDLRVPRPLCSQTLGLPDLVASRPWGSHTLWLPDLVLSRPLGLSYLTVLRP